MSNLNSAFSAGKALAAYFTCGDPSLEATYEAMSSAVSGGATMLFLGIPFSDPTAVDPVIQASNIRGLASGTATKDVFELIRDFRKDFDTPIILTAYANVVFSPGIEIFAYECREAQVQGVILHDVPFEEQNEFRSILGKYGIALISTVSPDLPERIPLICSGAEGFLYIVTGAATTLDEVRQSVNTIRTYSKLPCIIGCGVADAAPIEKFCAEADGAVLDYELVHIMEEYLDGAGRPIIRYIEKINDLLNRQRR